MPPGPVSDSYDPEFGTAANAEEIRDALKKLYCTVSSILKDEPPMQILDLVKAEHLNNSIQARLTEKEWRLIRFALERAQESL